MLYPSSLFLLLPFSFFLFVFSSFSLSYISLFFIGSVCLFLFAPFSPPFFSSFFPFFYLFNFLALLSFSLIFFFSLHCLTVYFVVPFPILSCSLPVDAYILHFHGIRHTNKDNAGWRAFSSRWFGIHFWRNKWLPSYVVSNFVSVACLIYLNLEFRNIKIV